MYSLFCELCFQVALRCEFYKGVWFLFIYLFNGWEHFYFILVFFHKHFNWKEIKLLSMQLIISKDKNNIVPKLLNAVISKMFPIWNLHCETLKLCSSVWLACHAFSLPSNSFRFSLHFYRCWIMNKYLMFILALEWKTKLIFITQWLLNFECSQPLWEFRLLMWEKDPPFIRVPWHSVCEKEKQEIPYWIMC